ncbi:MAG: flagellar hook-basal body complex protein [Rhodospirillaceae bacterium]|nr:flagellar hook-basal body complex protein [Rhodospirillaceae bacterium]MBT5013332.1 flagellar hook-basal body complex protein [Rhodospirillaceae bacterium]MBT5309565.1 flagellar hook-basal body complex protein [Rhodospirillaceae bacterium]MBT7356109.1 flagellar hook-basal body complex protein [Rhodospirillaceae bacterium]
MLNAAGDSTRRPADGSTVIIDGVTYEFDSDATSTATVAVDISSNTTLAQDVQALVNAVKGYDTDFANYGDTPTVNSRISISPGSSTTILFQDDGTKAIVVDPTGMLDSTGVRVSAQDNSFTVKKQDLAYTDSVQFKFTTMATDGDTVVINGLTYTFLTAEAADTAGGDRTIFTDNTAATAANLQTMLTDLEDAIEANDSNFASGGASVDIRAYGNSTTSNTLQLKSLSSGTYDVDFAGITGTTTTVTETDDTAFTGTTQAVNTAAGIKFSSDGLPNAVNVAEIEILDFDNGAANMDDDASNASQITLDFGTINEANGMTQFGASYTPVFINQDGSRFGTFAGVTVGSDGLVTALFDNGETRPIYQIPIATFVNVNGLESRTGNTWNASQASGDYTLRTADNGPAGQTVQGALEASTVDIGEEFTSMIVVQRAYSASAKIISTADQMLEELMRVKR